MSASENGFVILRAMRDLGAGLNQSILEEQIKKTAMLPEKDFKEAILYLEQSEYIGGWWSSGSDTQYQFNVEGINYLDTKIASRYPLSLEAERILKLLVELTSDDEPELRQTQVIYALHLDEEKYLIECQKLRDFGLINHSGFYQDLSATRIGRQAVHRNFIDPSASSIRVQQDDLSDVHTIKASGVLRQLIEDIKNCFDDDELDDLAFDLSVDYETLSGDNKAKKAKNLVRYCYRRKRLNELVENCRKERRNISWDYNFDAD